MVGSVRVHLVCRVSNMSVSENFVLVIRDQEGVCDCCRVRVDRG